MPTGYTAAVCDGKDVSFEGFVLTCARAFGALIEMRDSSFDAKIPEKFEPSEHHQEELKEARKELKRVEVMTRKEAGAAALAEYRKTKAAYDRMDEANAATNKRLSAMKAKVLAWIAPTPDHENLKAFMLQQLDLSMDGPCTLKAEKMSGAEWQYAKIKSLQENVKYHEKEYANEVKRAEERTKWVSDLRKSLKS